MACRKNLPGKGDKTLTRPTWQAGQLLNKEINKQKRNQIYPAFVSGSKGSFAVLGFSGNNTEKPAYVSRNMSFPQVPGKMIHPAGAEPLEMMQVSAVLN